MKATAMRDWLESRQIIVYFVAIGLGGVIGITAPQMSVAFEGAITPVLAALIYTTFLQVPLADLRGAMTNRRFLAALLLANFLVIPVFVWLLFQMVPDHSAVQLGVLLVLLTPCIDYVVVFTHMGRGNARLILAATPILLIVQILLLPLYLWLFLGPNTAELLSPGPFLAAFLWLIAVPLVLAWLTELLARRHTTSQKFTASMTLGPVPLMALTLFLVIGAELPRIREAQDIVLSIVAIYIVYAVVSPLIGWAIARFAHLDADAGRAVMFSTGTRNSLVVLPLALAAPFDGSLVAGVVVTQTLVELLAELAYIRLVPTLMASRPTRGG